MRRDNQGEVWYFAANAPHLPTLTLHTGQEQPLSLSDKVHLRLKAVPQKDKVSVQAVLQGDGDSGATLYHNGKRILLHYRLTDAQGTALGTGTLDYG